MADLEKMFGAADSRARKATADQGGYTNDPDGSKAREIMSDFAERQAKTRANCAHSIDMYGNTTPSRL